MSVTCKDVFQEISEINFLKIKSTLRPEKKFILLIERLNVVFCLFHTLYKLTN